MLLNIQGFTPSATSSQRWKLEHLTNLLCDKRFLVAAITETWLKPHIADAQININPYHIYRSDRVERVKGGVLLYIHKQIPVDQVETYDDDICQAIFCSSSATSHMLACVYKPCNASDLSFNNVLQFLTNCISSISDSYKYTKVILGDFNFPDLWKVSDPNVSPKTPSECSLINFMNNHFLCQYIDIATRQSNILDICLTNNDRLVQHLNSDKMEISDHNVVEIIIPNSELTKCVESSSDSDKAANKLKGFNAIDLHKGDFSAISKELEVVDWENLWSSSSLEDFPELLSNTVLNICEKHCPKKSDKLRKLTKHQRTYRSLMRKKKRLNTRLKCVRALTLDSPRVKSLEKKVKEVEDELKLLTFSKQEKDEVNAINKIKENPKYFYSYAKKHSATKSSISQIFNLDGDLLSNRETIANLLQDQFVSTFSDPSNPNASVPSSTSPSDFLSNISFDTEDVVNAIDEIKSSSSCPNYSLPALVLKKCKAQLVKPIQLLWNKSYEVGQVPSYYKKQLIAPVFKKGSRSYAKNYRPISLTPHEVKIFERIIKNKIIEFLENKSLLTSDQHGFRKGRSCTTQLLKQQYDILTNLMDGNDTDAIFLDFAKAFDKVDHKILYQKLQNIGISGKLLDWIKSFLSSRKQVVSVDGFLSYVADVISGVPQGTVLGPLLFLIYINDIHKCVLNSTISSFADDTRIGKAISAHSDCHLLQQDLDNITRWSKLNNMVLHENKFEYMNYSIRSGKFPLANLPFFGDSFRYLTSEGEILEPSETVLDLGVTFASNMCWSSHVANLTKTAKKKAGWVLSVFKNRSPCVMKTLFKSLIRSLLEYACLVWFGLPLENLRSIEAIQRSFTKKIVFPSSVNSYWERLQYLKMMSLQRRRERYAILHMWKILNNKTSNDLSITFDMNIRFGTVAKIPPLNVQSSMKSKSLFDSSFSVLGPSLWNRVPKHVRNITSLSNFKSKLDVFLMTIPDKPPVSGYVTQNNNSLLEWCPSYVL